MLRKQNGARLTADVTLLLFCELRLLVRHEGERSLSVPRMVLAGRVCDEGERFGRACERDRSEVIDLERLA